MKKHFRVLAIVVSTLAIGCGTASAYNKENMNSVILNMDGVPRMVTTEQTTVGDLMKDLAGTVDTKYVVLDAKNETILQDDMELTLTAVTEKVVSTTQTVAYESIKRDNKDMEIGQSKKVQSGVNGVKTVTNKEIYHGDKLVETVLVEETITTEPVPEIIEVGTKQPVNMIDGHRYSKKIDVRATAYTPYDPGCTGITATGIRADKGVVAVDPRVIPLGSKVYVPGYGVAIAADTGGAIKGNRLDVCYNSLSEAYTWGVKHVPVYILE